MIEMMLVVAIIGILSAVAIPTLQKYIAKSRTSEAAGTMSKLWSGAVAYYEADHADTTGAVKPKQFPGGGGSVVSEPPCCNHPDARCVANDPTYQIDAPDHPWVALNFNIPMPHIYRPWFYAMGPTLQAAKVQLYGDVDCDGIQSEFGFTGDVGGQDNMPRRSGWYSINETE
jgi:Tfp pilus assembly protein PilE